MAQVFVIAPRPGARVAVAPALPPPQPEALAPPVASTAVPSSTAAASEPASSTGAAVAPMTDSGYTSGAASQPMSTATQSSAGTSLAQIPDYRAAQQRRCMQAQAKGLLNAQGKCSLGQVSCKGVTATPPFRLLWDEARGSPPTARGLLARKQASRPPTQETVLSQPCNIVRRTVTPTGRALDLCPTATGGAPMLPQ